MTGLFILTICLSFLSQSACGPVSGQGSQTSESFDRLLIKRATLKSFPAQKPPGRDWDNRMAGLLPDIYVVLLNDDDGSILYSNPKSRAENASSNGKVSFPVNYTLTELDHSYTVTFYDYDSLTEHDASTLKLYGMRSAQAKARQGNHPAGPMLFLFKKSQEPRVFRFSSNPGNTSSPDKTTSRE